MTASPSCGGRIGRRLPRPPGMGQDKPPPRIYWRTNHGPLIRGVAQGMRMRRYLQVHHYEEALEAQLRASRGTTVAPYTGHAEAWFDRTDLLTVGQTPEGKQA